MFIIAGLGNPKPEYMHTRHNAGFDTIDIIGDKNGINVETLKLRSLIGKGMIAGSKAILAKPQTFMNLSGESIRPLVDYFKIDIRSELIVVYDDIYLAPGNIRIRVKGSAGGHNGMKSIINCLGTDEFMRVRVGVGEKPKGYDLADHVLSHFSQDEKEAAYSGMIRAANAIEMMIAGNVEGAMNEYNRKKDKETEQDII
ncbi:MAG: aminoacyl-tRNA hydrolase [Lachnospiraceae bacterium]|nr:aminoacyl-tRNA hydrolase [Lachnospiraceae bacterium]